RRWRKVHRRPSCVAVADYRCFRHVTTPRISTPFPPRPLACGRVEAVRGQAVWFEDVWSRGGKPRRQAIGTLSCGWRHEMAQPARTTLPAQGGVAVPVEVPMPEVPAVRRAEVAVQAHGT